MVYLGYGVSGSARRASSIGGALDIGGAVNTARSDRVVSSIKSRRVAAVCIAKQNAAKMTPATIIRSFQLSSDNWEPVYKFLFRLYIARAAGVGEASCADDGEVLLRALYAVVIAWKRAWATLEGIDWSTLSGW